VGGVEEDAVLLALLEELLRFFLSAFSLFLTVLENAVALEDPEGNPKKMSLLCVSSLFDDIGDVLGLSKLELRGLLKRGDLGRTGIRRVLTLIVGRPVCGKGG